MRSNSVHSHSQPHAPQGFDERRLRVSRPVGEATAWTEGRQRGANSLLTVQPRVAAGRERLGTVINVHQDRVKRRWKIAQDICDVVVQQRNALIAQRRTRQIPLGVAIPRNHIRDQFSHHYPCVAG